jgi:hypothetical protein
MHQNVGAPNFTRQTLLDIKGQISPDTVTVCDFNTLLSSTDRSSKIPPKNQQRKIRDKVCHISNGLNTHLQLSNLFQLPCMEYTSFSAIVELAPKYTTFL